MGGDLLFETLVGSAPTPLLAGTGRLMDETTSLFAPYCSDIFNLARDQKNPERNGKIKTQRNCEKRFSRSTVLSRDFSLTEETSDVTNDLFIYFANFLSAQKRRKFVISICNIKPNFLLFFAAKKIPN